MAQPKKQGQDRTTWAISTKESRKLGKVGKKKQSKNKKKSKGK